MKKLYILLTIMFGFLYNNLLSASQMLCNGKANLCDRKYNQIAQINVHNATSTRKRNFLYIPRIIPCGVGKTLTIPLSHYISRPQQDARIALSNIPDQKKIEDKKVGGYVFKK